MGFAPESQKPSLCRPTSGVGFQVSVTLDSHLSTLDPSRSPITIFYCRDLAPTLVETCSWLLSAKIRNSSFQTKSQTNGSQRLERLYYY